MSREARATTRTGAAARWVSAGAVVLAAALTACQPSRGASVTALDGDAPLPYELVASLGTVAGKQLNARIAFREGNDSIDISLDAEVRTSQPPPVIVGTYVWRRDRERIEGQVLADHLRLIEEPRPPSLTVELVLLDEDGKATHRVRVPPFPLTEPPRTAPPAARGGSA